MSTAKQSSISSPGNTASPRISANLTTPSSSTGERSADKLSLCSTIDQTFISPSTDQPIHSVPSPEKSSILPFPENTCPSISSSSADQTSLSASDYKKSHSLSSNETPSLQSSDESSTCRASDKKSTANQENTSSTIPLDARSDSIVETMDDMRSCIPGPSSTISSEPSESHGRQPTPSPNDAMVPTGSQLSQSTTSCDVAPDSVTIAIPPTALTSNTSVQTSQATVSKLKMNVMETTGSSASSLKKDTSIPSGSYACQTMSSEPTCVSGSAAIRPLMSIEVKPPAIPSLMSVKTTPPPFWRNDYAFGPKYRLAGLFSSRFSHTSPHWARDQVWTFQIDLNEVQA